MKLKFEALTIFQKFKIQVEKSLDRPIKSVQSDLGGEYSPLFLFLHKIV